MKVYIPEGYKSILGMYDTQKAISLIHRLFEDRLSALTSCMRPTTRPRLSSPWPSGSVLP